MSENFYTINYRQINEDETADDITVLSIDFPNEDFAVKFFKSIVHGNQCGIGTHYVELLHYHDDTVTLIERVEF